MKKILLLFYFIFSVNAFAVCGQGSGLPGHDNFYYCTSLDEMNNLLGSLSNTKIKELLGTQSGMPSHTYYEKDDCNAFLGRSCPKELYYCGLDGSAPKYVFHTFSHDNYYWDSWWNSTVEELPPCNDKPNPGDISYPREDYGNGCKNYSDLNDTQLELYPEQGGLVCNSCYVEPYNENSCLPPRVLDTSTNPPRCITPSCTPLSDVTVPLSQDDCKGNVLFLANGQAGSGSASYQQCDNTCYLLEPVPASCYDVGVKIRSQCDLDLNDFNFSCSQPDNGQGLTTYSSSCIPKNLKPVPNPCKIEHDKWFTDCSASGTVLRGNCVDNGLSIIDEDYHCEDNATNNPDCDTDWNEIPDGNGGCKCDVGYSYDRYHNCTLFNWDGNDSTPPTPTTSDSDSASHADSKKNHNTLKQQSSDLNGVRSDLNITNATLAGLRSDLNTTNNILSSMKNNLSDKLDATNDSLSGIKNILFNNNDNNFNLDTSVSAIDDGSIDSLTSFLNDVTSQYRNFTTNVTSQLDIIKYKYQQTRSLLEGGFGTVSIPSGSSDGCFQTSIYGKSIDINPCPYFSEFSPIIYFILTVSFMYYIFIFNFKYTLRSFE